MKNIINEFIGFIKLHDDGDGSQVPLTKLDAPLIDAWRVAAKDQELYVGEWLTNAAVGRWHLSGLSRTGGQSPGGSPVRLKILSQLPRRRRTGFY